jgi:hypothetical protein
LANVAKGSGMSTAFDMHSVDSSKELQFDGKM